ncbi:MAG: RNA 2',3'-cyclic phosphodiesterase [Ardenticatenales bacterium]|nr:RNA 2',3'-cyclic phosphodiesterase [Ardenticatenales bacterium]
MSESVRTFIAIQVPEEIGEALWQVQDCLQHLPPMRDLRWTDPFDAHITVKFLGETPVSQLPAIVEALDDVAKQWEPFPIHLENLGVFPNVHRPNVLWLGVEEGGKPLQHLYNAVEVALKKLGIKPERAEFHPHLTLARVPNEWSQSQRRALGELVGPTSLPEVPAFTTDAIALIRSQLGSDGPRYMRLGNSIFGEEPPLQEDDWEDEE